MKRDFSRLSIAWLAIFLVFIVSFTQVSVAFAAPLPANFSCTALNSVNLQKNDSGASVRHLQIILNLYPDTQIAATGTGSPGNENGRFGDMTYLAVIKFQNKYASAILTPIELTHGTGFVGTTTRIQLAKVCAQVQSASNTVSATTNTASSPSVGSIITQTTSATIAMINQKVSQLYVDVYNYIGGLSKITYIPSQDAPPLTISAQTTPPNNPQINPGSSPVNNFAANNTTTPAPSASTPSITQVTTPSVITAQKTTVNTTTPKSSSQTTQSTPPVTTQVVPAVTLPNLSTGIEWGAYVGNTISTDLPAFESVAGKPVNIVGIFFAFSDGFPVSYGSTVGSKGKTLLIFWEPSQGYDSIINGSEDADMKAFAAGAKSYGYPIILAPFNEMNLNQEAWGYGMNGNTAAKFQTAWKHMHDIFVSANATNVKFAIDYNSNSVPDISGNQFADYYPGDSYVDYIGIDGFNFGGPWETFGSIFDSAVAKANTFGKPIYLLSIASAPGSAKATWIADLGARIKTYSNVKGWVWFNENKEADWRINSDTAALQAFKAILP